jgi:hypothetical protein
MWWQRRAPWIAALLTVLAPPATSAAAHRAKLAASVQLQSRFSSEDRFAGPVFVGGAPVWAVHAANGQWLIRRAGRPTVTLARLPAVGVRRIYHPVALSGSGRFFTVRDSAFYVVNGHDMQYETRVDRVLVGGLGRPLEPLHALPTCRPAATSALSNWNAAIGDGTVAWLHFCADGADLLARRATGGSVLLTRRLAPPSLVPQSIGLAVAGKFVATLESDTLVVSNLLTGASYQVDPPPGRIVTGYAVQRDGTAVLSTGRDLAIPAPPFTLGWVSAAEPVLHPLPGSPVGQIVMSGDRVLFAEGPLFQPQRRLFVDEIPTGRRRFIARVGGAGNLIYEGAEPSFAIDAHHVAWAAEVSGGRRAPGPFAEVRVVDLPPGG